MEPIVETAASPLNVDVSMRESACGHSGIDHGAGVADNDESNGGSPVSGSDSESCGQHTEQLPSEGSPGNCDDEEEDGASSTDGSDSPASGEATAAGSVAEFPAAAASGDATAASASGVTSLWAAVVPM